MMRIDLNSDLGEGFGPWVMGDDAAMLALSPAPTSPVVAMRAILKPCFKPCALQRRPV